jgi:hypothetical protein
MSAGTTTYLDERLVRVYATEPGARPHVEIEGEVCLVHAKLRRCFPLTMSSQYVSVFDSGGSEVGILRDLAALDDESRRNVEAELDSFYFTPSISRIKSLKAEASMWKWEVETQRGQVVFYLRGVRDSVHEVAPNRWQVFSVDGQRYEIRNVDELDQRSQNLFEGLF